MVTKQGNSLDWICINIQNKFLPLQEVVHIIQLLVYNLYGHNLVGELTSVSRLPRSVWVSVPEDTWAPPSIVLGLGSTG